MAKCLYAAKIGNGDTRPAAGHGAGRDAHHDRARTRDAVGRHTASFVPLLQDGSRHLLEREHERADKQRSTCCACSPPARNISTRRSWTSMRRGCSGDSRLCASPPST